MAPVISRRLSDAGDLLPVVVDRDLQLTQHLKGSPALDYAAADAAWAPDQCPGRDASKIAPCPAIVGGGLDALRALRLAPQSAVRPACGHRGLDARATASASSKRRSSWRLRTDMVLGSRDRGSFGEGRPDRRLSTTHSGDPASPPFDSSPTAVRAAASASFSFGWGIASSA